jgi:membrane-associated phospholipid phosphatase
VTVGHPSPAGNGSPGLSLDILAALHSPTLQEPPAPPNRDQDIEPNAGSALALGILTLIVIYGLLFFYGFRFFVIKTAVMPIFVLYAVVVRRRLAFLTDWLPLIAGTVLFDALRGAIFVAIQRQHLPVYLAYPSVLEQTFFRTPAAPLPLQQWQTRWLDIAAVAVHASHFAFFLLFGLVLWHLRPAYFLRFRRALLLVMAIGLLGYLCVPTIPPWLASQQFHLLPPINHVVTQVYTNSVGDLYGTFDTNPVAAMPSLHAAFPAMCALIGFLAYGKRAGVMLALYATAVMLAVVYLGEHYAVDVVAGVGVAAVAVRGARRPWLHSFSFVQSLSVSAAVLGLTMAILLVYG